MFHQIKALLRLAAPISRWRPSRLESILSNRGPRNSCSGQTSGRLNYPVNRWEPLPHRRKIYPPSNVWITQNPFHNETLSHGKLQSDCLGLYCSQEQQRSILEKKIFLQCFIDFVSPANLHNFILHDYINNTPNNFIFIILEPCCDRIQKYPVWCLQVVCGQKILGFVRHKTMILNADRVRAVVCTLPVHDICFRDTHYVIVEIRRKTNISINNSNMVLTCSTQRQSLKTMRSPPDNAPYRWKRGIYSWKILSISGKICLNAR